MLLIRHIYDRKREEKEETRREGRGGKGDAVKRRVGGRDERG